MTFARPDVPPSGKRDHTSYDGKIRLLHVITRFEAGAGGNTLLSAMGMDPRRYEVWVAGGAGGPLWKRARAAGVRTVELPRFRREVAPLDDLLVLGSLVRLLHRERFSIVHLHAAKGGALGRLAARVIGCPVVVYTLHGRDPWWPSRPSAPDPGLEDLMGPLARRAFLFVERALRPATDAFVAVAPAVAADAVRAGVATTDRIEVVPSAVDLGAIPLGSDPKARRDLGVPEGVPLIGTVGRLDRQKAPLDFVRMAAIVTRSRPDARFVMIGDGELAQAARVEARRWGVRIHFTGFRQDAPRLASSFDVFVVSSLYEGVGRSLTEALASGRPVVATAVDGLVDVIRPGVTGLLAPPHAPAKLAAQVVWLLEHPDDARAMGSAGRALVRKLFQPEVMCELLDRLYGRLLGLPAPVGTESSAGAIPPGWVPDLAMVPVARLGHSAVLRPAAPDHGI